MNNPTSFLILADESATWRVAGLAQLDRLVLALNEFVEAQTMDQVVDATIFWHPDVAPRRRWLPRHPRITRLRLTEATQSVAPGARILSTRLFVQRNGLAEFLTQAGPVNISEAPVDTPNSWSDLATRFSNTLPSRDAWFFLKTTDDIPRCERTLLRRSGKSQDGFISRLFNRPLSRRLSRVLLRYDITPTAWTIYGFALPVLAFIGLARGDYIGIVAGALIFQVYSIVDGCDGEIARATYLESERGGRIDDFLDMLGSILFVIGLGLGLFRSGSSIFLLEGILCGAVIAINEWSLRRLTTTDRPESDKLADSLYPRHRRLFAGTELAKVDGNALWWIVQFTKRDVAIFFFLILALLDQAQWILHLWLAVSAGTLLLSARSSSDQGSSIGPTT